MHLREMRLAQDILVSYDCTTYFPLFHMEGFLLSVAEESVMVLIVDLSESCCLEKWLSVTYGSQTQLEVILFRHCQKSWSTAEVRSQADHMQAYHKSRKIPQNTKEIREARKQGVD